MKWLKVLREIFIKIYLHIDIVRDGLSIFKRQKLEDPFSDDLIFHTTYFIMKYSIVFHIYIFS